MCGFFNLRIMKIRFILSLGTNIFSFQKIDLIFSWALKESGKSTVRGMQLLFSGGEGKREERGRYGEECSSATSDIEQQQDRAQTGWEGREQSRWLSKILTEDEWPSPERSLWPGKRRWIVPQVHQARCMTKCQALRTHNLEKVTGDKGGRDLRQRGQDTGKRS